MKILRAPSCAALPLVVAAAALLGSACASSVSGAPAPEPGGSDRPSATAPLPQTRPQAAAGTCRVTASSSGSISSSGAGGRTVTTNGRTSFSCGSGPLIAIESIEASGVTFGADGTVVTVAPGSAQTVGAYRITVATADSDRAEFQVEPAG